MVGGFETARSPGACAGNPRSAAVIFVVCRPGRHTPQAGLSLERMAGWLQGPFSMNQLEILAKWWGLSTPNPETGHP